MDFRLDKLVKLRNLPRPEAGIRAMVNRAPEAEALADRALSRMRPAFAWMYQARRRLATGLVGVATAWMLFHVMFGANGMVVYRQKRADYQQKEKQLQELQKENDNYSSQIKALQTDPETIEKEAREQLHYARPGEVIYVPPAPAATAPPAQRSAQK